MRVLRASMVAAVCAALGCSSRPNVAVPSDAGVVRLVPPVRSAPPISRVSTRPKVADPSAAASRISQFDPAQLTVSSTPPGMHIPAGEWPALQTDVPLYALKVAPADLDALDQNLANTDFEVPGQFTFDGRTWSVMVRYRGRSTRYLPKKSFQLKFPDADPFVDGSKQLELLAEWKDGGLLTEKMWFDLAAAVGLRVPSATFVRLNLNDGFYGVMVQVEAVKKSFLVHHGMDTDGDVYRCGMFDCEMREPPQESYQEPWDKRTNENEPWDALWTFLRGIHQTTPSHFAQWVGENVEIEDYLAWLAVDAFISNDTIGDAKSFWIREKRTGRWTYVPWDLNNALSLFNRTNGIDQWPNASKAMGDFTVLDPDAYTLAAQRQASGDPAFATMKPAWSDFTTRVLEDPDLRARMLQYLNTLLQTRFREEEVGPRADAMAALISPYLAQDPWVDPAFPPQSASYLRWYVRLRRDFLMQHLDDWARFSPGALRIQRVGRAADGSAFVELENAGSADLALSGRYLTGWLRIPRQAKLPARTLGPGEVLHLTAQDLLAEQGGFTLDPSQVQVGLFDTDGVTALDVVYLSALAPGAAWSRDDAGPVGKP